MKKFLVLILIALMATSLFAGGSRESAATSSTATGGA